MVSWQAAASVLPSCNDLPRKKNIPQYSAVYITETEEEFTLYRHVTTPGGGESAGHSQARAYLQHFLQENAVHLQNMLCGYVVKMGLATGENVELVAAEVFQDAALETLAHAERFNPTMQARPWFLAIAANILKRHRADYLKRYRFEVLAGNLARRETQESAEEVLDQIMGARAGMVGPEQAFVARESARELLALVAPEDAQLLHMALIQGWDASALGQLMGVTPGAARVRVHRALSRLRAAWRQSQERKERSGYHG
jgi:RNA polymerase sigma factor (sigma-70 family)